MIEVNNLHKSYEDRAVLNGITFRVEAGEVFGFLGPNGAGKTTTLRILTGQLFPSYGSASILGLDASSEASVLQGKIGIVPERSNLYERLTVSQNLEFFCRLYGSDISAVNSLLERVGMDRERHTQVKKLSKGMRQKVLLVRALLHKPSLLFLDEPTSGLDPASASVVQEFLKDLNREGMTIFLTSHNMEEVDRLCGRVAFLDKGRLAAIGTPGELKLRYSGSRLKVLIQTEDGLAEKELELSGEESARMMYRWMAEGKVRSVHSSEPTLGDIFMKVTGRDIA